MTKRSLEEISSNQTSSSSSSSSSLSTLPESIPVLEERPVQIAFAGHRGFGANQVQRQRNERARFPENSLISLQEVIRSGADFIEFDLYLSRDNHLIVIHDDDLSINAHYIVQRENEMAKPPEQGGGFYPIGQSVPFTPNSETFVSRRTAAKLRRDFDISKGLPIPLDCPPNAQYLYRRVPEFTEVLQLVSAENARRVGLGLPRVGLNVELKGVGTGAFVQKAIEDFNASKSGADKIQQNEIFYISFLDRELATIAGLVPGSKGSAVPDANLILGVPTTVQYTQVGHAYAIEDSTLNLPQLTQKVEGLHKALQILPSRGGNGLTGVDVSMWDVGDDSIKYFCGILGVPIHIAVVPFGHKDFARDEVGLALVNIEKIAAAQGKYLGSSVTMIIKTDDPALLKEILETQRKSIASEITSAEIMRSGRALSRDNEAIILFPKPGTKAAHGKFMLADNSWWGDQQLIPSLQAINRGHVFNPVVNEHGLILALQRAITRPENSFIIPINVNVIEGELNAGEANHWVGLRLVRNADDRRFNVDYVDPMGRPINGRVRDLITGTLGDNLVGIAEPFTGRAIQAAQLIEHVEAEERIVEFIGNINDCGPMLVYAMDDPVKRGNLPNIPLTGRESRELGQSIRRHFAGIINTAVVVPEVTTEPRLETNIEREELINRAKEIGRNIKKPRISNTSEKKANTGAHNAKDNKRDGDGLGM